MEKPPVEDVSPIKNGDFPLGRAVFFSHSSDYSEAAQLGPDTTSMDVDAASGAMFFFSRRVVDWNMLLMKEIHPAPPGMYKTLYMG